MKAVGFFLVIVMVTGFSMEEESEIDEDALHEYYDSNDTGENATTVTKAPKIVETTSAEGSGYNSYFGV